MAGSSVLLIVPARRLERGTQYVAELRNAVDPTRSSESIASRSLPDDPNEFPACRFLDASCSVATRLRLVALCSVRSPKSSKSMARVRSMSSAADPLRNSRNTSGSSRDMPAPARSRRACSKSSATPSPKTHRGLESSRRGTASRHDGLARKSSSCRSATRFRSSIEHLKGHLQSRSSSTSRETSVAIDPNRTFIQGITVAGHPLVVELDTQPFVEHVTVDALLRRWRIQTSPETRALLLSRRSLGDGLAAASQALQRADDLCHHRAADSMGRRSVSRLDHLPECPDDSQASAASILARCSSIRTSGA